MKGKKEVHFYGRDGCGCSICSGEDKYLEEDRRKIKAWDEANIQW